jgi:hypothetical protein
MKVILPNGRGGGGRVPLEGGRVGWFCGFGFGSSTRMGIGI